MNGPTHPTTSPSSNPTLPNEIRLLIVRELGTLQHPKAFKYSRSTSQALLALALTNRAFNEWVTPILFRHIGVSAPQLKNLLYTLCLYRLPYTRSAPPILSLRVSGGQNGDVDKSPKTALWHEELYYVLELAAPTLKRICLPIATQPKISQSLNQMYSLDTCVIKPQNTLPQLSPHTQRLAIYTNKLEAGIITPTYNEYLDALSSATNLKHIIIAEPNLAYSVDRHAWFIMALAQHFQHLTNIVVVPWVSTLGLRPNANQPLRWLLNYLEPAGADPALVLRLRGLVKYARVPLVTADIGSWLMQKFDDGTAWELETVPYYDLVGVLHPVVRPPAQQRLPIWRAT